MGSIKLELDLQSPYNPDGSPRQDLPKGEVLGLDGREWCNGVLEIVGVGIEGTPTFSKKVILVDLETKQYIFLHNVVRFAPLPTIIEEDDLL